MSPSGASAGEPNSSPPNDGKALTVVLDGEVIALAQHLQLLVGDLRQLSVALQHLRDADQSGSDDELPGGDAAQAETLCAASRTISSARP